VTASADQLGERIEALETELAALREELRQTRDWEDVDDQWTEVIKAAYPTRSGSHDEYGIAMRMVSSRRSKGQLVALVNWLLVEQSNAIRELGAERETADRIVKASEEDRLRTVKETYQLQSELRAAIKERDEARTANRSTVDTKKLDALCIGAWALRDDGLLASRAITRVLAAGRTHAWPGDPDDVALLLVRNGFSSQLRTVNNEMGPVETFIVVNNQQPTVPT